MCYSFVVCKYIYSIYLNPYVVATYCISYMTKINKPITSYLHSITQKCIANNIDANTRIQKLGNVIFNVEQIVVQLAIYLVFVYHYIIHLEHCNSSIFLFLKNVFLC